MPSTLLFSVVIPTRHRNELLARCLDRLKSGTQTLSADHYEVIVTDDGCDTTAEEMVRTQYPWVRWVAGPRRGPAANRNNGARLAQGEWLVFTDDDCVPDAQWLQVYAEAIAQHPSYSILEGRVYVDRPQRSLAEKSPINETGGYLWSCNLAIRKALFESLQGFDERFPYAAMEDVELRFRLTQAGQPFLFVQQAAICHPWRICGGWRELKQHQQSTFLYLSIHPEESTRIHAIYYLRFTLRALLKTTLPGCVRLKGRGLLSACLEHLAFLQMSLLLWLNASRFHARQLLINHETH